MVEYFGCSSINGDWTRDLVFVNHRVVKSKAKPEYEHILYARERVEFAKAYGPQDFWAAGVPWLSEYSSPVKPEP